MTLKPGDHIRVRENYYPKWLDASLVHVIRSQSHGDRYTIYCVSPVVWEDVMERVDEAATCMLCLAQEDGPSTLGEDLRKVRMDLAKASHVPVDLLFGKKWL